MRYNALGWLEDVPTEVISLFSSRRLSFSFEVQELESKRHGHTRNDGDIVLVQ